MPRFVVLEHRFPAGSDRTSHWDLMLESAEDLLTWACENDPFTGRATSATALPNHRVAYLDFEGEISRGRGTVRQVYAGNYLWLDLQPGRRTLFLECADHSQWILRMDESVDSDTSQTADSVATSSKVRLLVQPVSAQAQNHGFDWRGRKLPRRGVIGVIQRQSEFLVIQRSQTVRAPGAFCFPGGTVESGETDEIALQRELWEELAIVAKPKVKLWESRSPWGVELCWMAAEVSPDVQWTMNASEVAWAGWMTLEHMATLDPLLPSNRAFLRAWANGQLLRPVAEDGTGKTDFGRG